MIRIMRTAGVAMGLVLVVLALTTTVASAAGQDAGSVTITDVGGTKPLGSGESGTEFVPKLPAGSECQGDSLNDGYRLQSFMIPVDDDPSVLVYENTKPAGDGRYPLYTASTAGYRQQLTLPNDGPGEPGVIGELPSFSFAAFEGSPVQGGTYRVGFACTLDNETTRYWDTVLVVARSTDSSGPQFSWTWDDAGAADTGTSSSSPSPLLWIAIAVVVIALVAFVIWRRSSTPVPPSSKELS